MNFAKQVFELQKKKKNTEMLTSIIFPYEATWLRVPLSSDNGTSPHFYPTNQNKQGKDKLKIKRIKLSFLPITNN
jgi:hypothetical protein